MNWKKFGVYSILLLVLAIPLIASVLAQTTSPGDAARAVGDAATRGLDQPIDQPVWFVELLNFLGIEKTWALVIVSVAILVMIFAAAYGILEFTAFENKMVIGAIAAAIAVVAAVSRGVMALSALFMAIAGGSVVIGTMIAIGVAIVFFIGASYFKGRMKMHQAKISADEAKAGAIMAGAAAEGLGDIAKGMKAAAKKAT